MADTSYWDKRRGKVFNAFGGWKVNEGVKFGDYDLLDDLIGEWSYFRQWTYATTGIQFSAETSDWVEGMMMGVSYPDSRIWCNQIAVYSAATRTSGVVATSNSLTSGDTLLYGAGALRLSASFLYELKRTLDENPALTLADLVEMRKKESRGKLVIPGFARPVANGDERIPVMLRTAKKFNVALAEYYDLALALEEITIAETGDKMNFGGFCAAALLDLGLTPDNTYQVGMYAIGMGAIACYTDAMAQPTTAFMPLRCDDMEYQGAARRAVPPR